MDWMNWEWSIYYFESVVAEYHYIICVDNDVCKSFHGCEDIFCLFWNHRGERFLMRVRLVKMKCMEMHYINRCPLKWRKTSSMCACVSGLTHMFANKEKERKLMCNCPSVEQPVRLTAKWRSDEWRASCSNWSYQLFRWPTSVSLQFSRPP